LDRPLHTGSPRAPRRPPPPAPGCGWLLIAMGLKSPDAELLPILSQAPNPERYASDVDLRAAYAEWRWVAAEALNPCRPEALAAERFDGPSWCGWGVSRDWGVTPPAAMTGVGRELARTGGRSRDRARRCRRAVRLNRTAYCHKEFSCNRSKRCGVADTTSDGSRYVVQNLSQKSATSAYDFCERYPIEKTKPKFAGMRRANVSSSARSPMTVHRPAQTHGPSARQASDGRSAHPRGHWA